MTEDLDYTDIRILRTLQKNARLTIKELAQNVDLSSSPVYERQKRLEREGYIKKYVAVLDPKKLDVPLMAFCRISLRQQTKKCAEDFIEIVNKIDAVSECWNVSGDYDFLMKLYVRDMKDYQDFVLNTLGTLSCIGSLHSIFVLDEVKGQSGIPLRK